MFEKLFFLKRDDLLLLVGLLIPALLVFRALLLPGTAIWGDAPFFYPEGLKELVSQPFAWTAHGHNFGGFNEFLWIYPLMFIYGALYNFFGFGNDFIIRILFYFPAISLSLLGPILFTRYLGYPKLVQFFASFFYTLNTYFILLVDGGQVGVALAYGIFPLALLYLYRLIVKADIDKFLGAFITLCLLLVADIRVAAICLITLFFWLTISCFLTRSTKSIINLKWLILVLMCTTVVSSYWIFPLLSSPLELISEVSGLQLTSLLNSILIFQPHWPGNEFGKVSAPPFYFIGIPLLLFIGLVFRKTSLRNITFTFLFLLFGFLAKGNTPPAGEIYEWFVLHVPFGTAFRDSTKFFIPMTLFGGILMASSVEALISKYKKYTLPVVGGAYVYLILLVHPAILGNLHGVLKPKSIQGDFNVIGQKLVSDSGFARTAWFSGIHPFSFHTGAKPAIDASRLVSLRPFASLNVGGDVFNFIYQNAEFLDWFNLLGIKYLVFSGNPRVVSQTQEDMDSWQKLTSRVATIPGLTKESWDTSFPVYSIPDVKPRIFAVDKAIVVLGSENIYQKIREVNSEFSVGNQAFFFLEDGKFSAFDVYEALTKESGIMVFNNKNETDLAMNFLRKYFVSPKGANFSQWAVRNSSDYLKWRYELLTKGVDTKEFDYGMGVAFSTVPGEKMSFVFDVEKDGQYILAVRRIAVDGKFAWTTEEIELDSGEWRKEFTSFGDIDVINTVALIPKDHWDFAHSQAKTFIDQSDVIRVDGLNDESELAQLTNSSKWHELEYQKIDPVNYTVSLPQKNSWIVFTDTYSGGWHIQTDEYYHWSSPAYSEFNGFFVHDYDKTASIYYSGQKYLEIGERVSIISLVAIAVVSAGLYARRRKA